MGCYSNAQRNVLKHLCLDSLGLGRLTPGDSGLLGIGRLGDRTWESGDSGLVRLQCNMPTVRTSQHWAHALHLSAECASVPDTMHSACTLFLQLQNFKLLSVPVHHKDSDWVTSGREDLTDLGCVAKRRHAAVTVCVIDLQKGIAVQV